MAGAHHVPFVSSGPLYISISKITGQKQRLHPHFTLIHHSGVSENGGGYRQFHRDADD